MSIARRIAPVIPLTLVLAAAASAEPPTVRLATPDNADVVAHTLTELRFEFDQPMRRGSHSLCGGGPAFPAITGPICWEDDYTLVVPVALEPDHSYQFSLNCQGASNFRSADGEVLAPYPINFRTAADGEALPALGAGVSEAAFEALRLAIDSRYSYRDLRGVDWEVVLEEHRPAIHAAGTPSELARAVAAALAPAQDAHINILVDRFGLPTHRRAVSPNIEPRLMHRLVPGMRQVTNRVHAGQFEDGVHYLLISGWDSPSKEQDIAALLPVIDAMDGAAGLIIDVRLNGGGDEDLACRIAARLASREAVYSRSLLRDPREPDGFAGPFDRAIAPDPDRPDGYRPPARIAVLIGQVCMSSNESFIHMMREACDARLIGDRTYGSSGNPKAHEIGGGVTVLLPSWQDVGPDGAVLEGKGIEPDEAIEWPGDDTDPVLEAGLRWVRGSTGP